MRTRIATARENPRLPGIKLEADIAVTNDLAPTAQRRHRPGRRRPRSICALRSMRSRRIFARPTPVIACAKGIERGTHKFMTEIIAESAPHAVPAILSGPSFAEDVARGLPDRRDAGRKGRRRSPPASCRRWARRPSGPITPRRARRRDRRRGQERAGDRRRHRRRQEARRLGAGRADHARLLRAGAARPRLRRARRNHGRPFGTRRPDPDLLQPAIAQFRARACARPRRAETRRESSPRASSPLPC